MKRKHYKWLSIGIVSFCCLLLLVTGAGMALSRSLIHNTRNKPVKTDLTQKNTKKQTTMKSKPTLKGPITIFAMGDSLTRGYGDSTNLGYVGNLQHDLEAKGLHVTVDNIAVNGYVSSQLVNQIKDSQIQKRIASSNVIVLSIGGNDLVHTVVNFKIPTVEQTQNTEQVFLNHLKTILQTIRSNNQNAPILMVGLYNPFLQLQGGAQGTAVVADWNYHTSTLLRSFPNTYLVPTLDLFTANGDQLLYDDHFHPNSIGYKAIANRMLQDLYINQQTN